MSSDGSAWLLTFRVPFSSLYRAKRGPTGDPPVATLCAPLWPLWL